MLLTKGFLLVSGAPGRGWPVLRGEASDARAR